MADVFAVYIQMTLITAGVLAAPWMVYQLWQFVAAGLYPNERKYITRYLPLSIGLLISGMLLLYFMVLPISLDFFFTFSLSLPLEKMGLSTPAKVATTGPAFRIPAIAGDPEHPEDYQLWFDTTRHQLKGYFGGQTQTIQFGPHNLTTPLITLPDYINMVLQLLLAFGLSFQLPLVVMALERVGIIDIETLRGFRRYAYFAMTVLAAFIIPDVVTGMLALTVPLILLYELGVYLAGRKRKMG